MEETTTVQPCPNASTFSQDGGDGGERDSLKGLVDFSRTFGTSKTDQSGMLSCSV